MFGSFLVIGYFLVLAGEFLGNSKSREPTRRLGNGRLHERRSTRNKLQPMLSEEGLSVDDMRARCTPPLWFSGNQSSCFLLPLRLAEGRSRAKFFKFDEYFVLLLRFFFLFFSSFPSSVARCVYWSLNFYFFDSRIRINYFIEAKLLFLWPYDLWREMFR